MGLVWSGLFSLAIWLVWGISQIVDWFDSTYPLSICFRRISPFFVSITSSMATNNFDVPILIIGRIYEVRQSIKRAFGISEEEPTKTSLSSTDSSASACHSGSTSTKSSRKKTPKRPYTRSCLLWSKKENTCTLLLITTFNSTDPMSDEKLANSFSLTRKELSKRLLSIHNTKPIVGRPSIHFHTMPSSGDNLDPNRESYLVLIPVSAEPNSRWIGPTQATFHAVDLLNINELLADLTEDNRQKEELKLLRREVEFLRRENQFLKDKQLLEHEQAQIEITKKEMAKKMEETAQEKKAQDRFIATLFSEANHESDQPKQSDCETSPVSSIPQPLCHTQLWEIMQNGDDIFSDEDNDETSSFQRILSMHAVVESNASRNHRIQHWLYTSVRENPPDIDVVGIDSLSGIPQESEIGRDSTILSFDFHRLIPPFEEKQRSIFVPSSDQPCEQTEYFLRGRNRHVMTNTPALK